MSSVIKTTPATGGGGTGRDPIGTTAQQVARSRRDRVIDVLLSNAMLGVLLIVVIIAQVVYPRFLTPENIQLVLTQNAQLGIIAVGMTVVIISGSFDLSVVPIYIGTAAVFATYAPVISLPVALLLAILIGVVAGVVNGFVVTKLGVNSFIATLGTGAIIGGIVQVGIGSGGVSLDDPASQVLGQGRFLGIGMSIFVLFVLFAIGQIVMANTVYGRAIFTVGGNAEAARLAGLSVNWLKTSAFMVSGACAAIAGVIFASRIGFVQVSQISSESGLLLDAIAVVVVGGTSLWGGQGAVWRSAIGLLIYASLSNVFSALAIEPTTANIVKGAVLIGAVSIDTYVRRRRAR